jgi:Tol biopolymer transport system component
MIPSVGAPKLWAMTPEGAPLARIYGRGDEVGETPIWSPDGGSVAFREVFVEQGLTMLIVTDLSSPPIKMPIGVNSRISWAPDGQWLAYDEIPPNSNGRSQIVIVRTDGTGRQLLFPTQTDYDTAPVWSPDGTQLAFDRRVRDTPPTAVAAPQEVWTANRDGHLQRRLFGQDMRATEDLRWSPDGGLLAATRYTVIGKAERGVWLVNKDGASAREIAKGATHPIWVPMR